MLRCINCQVTGLHTQRNNPSLRRSKFRCLNRWKRTRSTSKRRQIFRLSAISSKTCSCLTISVASIWWLRLKTNLCRYSTFRPGLACTSLTSRLKICNEIELPKFWVKLINDLISNSNKPSSTNLFRTIWAKRLNFKERKQLLQSNKSYLSQNQSKKLQCQSCLDQRQTSNKRDWCNNKANPLRCMWWLMTWNLRLVCLVPARVNVT